MTTPEGARAIPDVELSECNGEMCGGPYDHNICMNCGMESPSVWDDKFRPLPPDSQDEGLA